MALLAFAAFSVAGCYSYYEKNWTDLNLKVGEKKICTASWYGRNFHKKLTASGDQYNMYDVTCAHKKYPFGTIVRVTNLANGKNALCVVNDRGPFFWFRKLDLSYGVAKKLGFVEQGVGDVEVEVLGRDYGYSRYVEQGPLRKAKALTIEVGSFKDRRGARQLMAELRQSYRNVYLCSAVEDNERSYKVRVGKFKSRAAALKAAARMAEEGYNVMILPHT